MLTVFQYFFSHARPQISYTVITFFCIFGLAISNTVLIWYLGKPFSLLQQQQFHALNHTLLILVGIVLVNQAAQLGTGYFSEWVAVGFLGKLRNTVFHHVLKLGFTGSPHHSKGDILTRLNEDSRQVSDLVVMTPFLFFSYTLTILFYFGMLLWINWQWTLLGLLFVPLLIIHQRYFSCKKRRAAAVWYENKSKLAEYEEDSLSNLRSINSFTAENAVQQSHKQHFQQAGHWQLKDKWISTAFQSSLSLMIYAMGIILLVVGVFSLEAGQFNIGEFLSFLLYLGYITVPARELAHITFQRHGYLAAADRVREVLQELPPVTTPADAALLTISTGSIELRDLCFGYSPAHKLFNLLNLSLPGGKTIALVGGSGSGKTSLVKLLMRFHALSAGAIYIDQQNIAQVDLRSLRQQIGIVWQEPLLISSTLRANLELAKPSATLAEMRAALEKAQLWSFVESLPSGLDTHLGPQGVDLSTGQKQRVALAQIFLRNCPIVILDEFSSAQDSKMEKNLLHALGNLREGRTTLIIAHRFSSIRNADCVLFFRGDGSVVLDEHQHLMEKVPAYRQAVEWQTQTSRATSECVE